MVAATWQSAFHCRDACIISSAFFPGSSESNSAVPGINTAKISLVTASTHSDVD
jgi:hypothetical protein